MVGCGSFQIRQFCTVTVCLELVWCKLWIECTTNTAFDEWMCSKGITETLGEEDSRPSLGRFCKHEWTRSAWSSRPVLPYLWSFTSGVFDCGCRLFANSSNGFVAVVGNCDYSRQNDVEQDSTIQFPWANKCLWIVVSGCGAFDKNVQCQCVA